jgi:hypothetical protein
MVPVVDKGSSAKHSKDGNTVPVPLVWVITRFFHTLCSRCKHRSFRLSVLPRRHNVRLRGLAFTGMSKGECRWIVFFSVVTLTSWVTYTARVTTTGKLFTT